MRESFPGMRQATIAGMFLGTAPSIIHDLTVVLDHAEDLPRDLRQRLQDARDRLQTAYVEADSLQAER